MAREAESPNIDLATGDPSLCIGNISRKKWLLVSCASQEQRDQSPKRHHPLGSLPTLFKIELPICTLGSHFIWYMLNFTEFWLVCPCLSLSRDSEFSIDWNWRFLISGSSVSMFSLNIQCSHWIPHLWKLSVNTCCYVTKYPKLSHLTTISPHDFVSQEFRQGSV